MVEKIDYDKIGLKAGLEIHQQLDTGKLFCSCPGYLRSEEPDFIVKRKLHAVAGETGEVDNAVKHEASLDKEFIYQGYNNSTCLVELDEEPPHEINKFALIEAMKIALLLNCEIYQVSQIMRKTVINGSNTSGFQRTVLVAHDGYIETSFGKVKIEGVFLEEDSARPVGQAGEDDDGGSGQVVYRLDRLGIPLVEISTAPDMKRPEQIKEAALKIGEILRACKVKRGIGTIRQDINVSIKGTNKVEIKGFQDPAMMEKTTDIEIMRQKALVEINDILKEKDKIKQLEVKGLEEVFKNTKCGIINNSLNKGGIVLGARLKGFEGILGKEIQPGKRFGSEVSYRAKMHGVGGIIHSDEDINKYNLSEEEVKDIKIKLGVQKGDAYIIIADEKQKAIKAMNSALERINQQKEIAVPGEVRWAYADGTTEFKRPMPGKARMYPETDLPLLRIGRDKINEIKKILPKTRAEIKQELSKKGLNDELVTLVLDGHLDEFQILSKVYDKDSNLVAKMVVLWRNEIATKNKKSFEEVKEKLSERVLEEVLEALIEKKINEGDIKGVMIKVFGGEKLEEALKVERVDDNLLEEQIRAIVKEKPGFRANAYMGLVIGKLGPGVDKRKAMEILNKIVG